MNLLYIHGFNGSVNSSTYKKLQELFPEHHWFSETLDLTDVEQTKNRIQELYHQHKIHLIIASSLGAFYTLGITDSVGRIVINPCLKPSIEIPKLESTVPQQVIDQWKLEEQRLFAVDSEVKQCTFGIFGNHDELFSYKNEFDDFYRTTNIGLQKSFLVEGGHHALSSEILKKYVQKGFDYMHLVSEHFDLADSVPFLGYDDDEDEDPELARRLTAFQAAIAAYKQD